MASKKIISVWTLLAVAGCQAPLVEQESRAALPSVPQSAQTKLINSQPLPPPESVQQELLPGTLGPVESGRSLLAEPRFDIAANNVDVRHFFANLMQQSPYSIAFHPDVSGAITLQLKQVTLAETLSVVEDIFGYSIRREGRVFRIFPAAMRTETFSFNYLLLERVGVSQTSISSGGVSERDGNSNRNNSRSNNSGSSFNNNNANSTGSSDNRGAGSSTGSGANGTVINSRTDTNLWQELEETLTGLIQGEGRRVMVSPQSGLVTVKAYPDEIRVVKEYLGQSQAHLQRQVILEARIVEVRLSDGFQQGIEWSSVLGHAGSTDLIFSTSAGTLGDQLSANLGNITSLRFENADFTGVVNLLKTQGEVNVLSSPRITATNNQKAVIKVGDDEYFVTDVSSTTSNVGDNVQANPDVELTPFFSGIALDVTPQIDESGAVLLHVHPSVIDVEEQNKQIEVQGQSFQLPLARSSIRESDTVIKAQTGDVVVIGGLMSTNTREQTSRVPLLGDIPILGEAFTNRLEVLEKTELVILLRPTVISQGGGKAQRQRSQSLLKQWDASEQ